MMVEQPIGDEAGFTLVELLVALAIASTLMVAIGGYYFTASRFGERQHEFDNDLIVIDQLLTARSEISEIAATIEVQASLAETGDVVLSHLRSGDTPIDIVTISSELGSNGALSSIIISSDRHGTDVIIPEGKEANLEFMTSDESAWRTADQIASQPVSAIRLLATFSGFSSAIVLWSSSGS